MVTIFLEYFYWHYTVAPFDILQIMQNHLKANWHRFLIVQHLRTLFSPWHRQNPSDLGKNDRAFGDKILDSVADIYIRLIAACVRLIIIIFGFLAELIILISFLLLFIIWLAWPLLAVGLVIKGFSLISSI